MKPEKLALYSCCPLYRTPVQVPFFFPSGGWHWGLGTAVGWLGGSQVSLRWIPRMATLNTWFSSIITKGATTVAAGAPPPPCIHTYIHTYIHTPIHVHRHTYTCSRPCVYIFLQGWPRGDLDTALHAIWLNFLFTRLENLLQYRDPHYSHLRTLRTFQVAVGSDLRCGRDSVDRARRPSARGRRVEVFGCFH